MSQNGPYPGPPWPGGSSDDEPYAEPADPWGEHAVADPSWSSSPSPIPHQPSVSYQPSSFPHPPPNDPPAGGGSPMWGPPAAPPKRNTPIVALVVVLGLLIVVGLGPTAWLLRKQLAGRAQPRSSPSAPPTTYTGSVQGSEDARFVKVDDCVQNEGSNDQPAMHKSVCLPGTYRVLKVIKGRATGQQDAQNKCAQVRGYTNWFFYDSDLDDLDVVLCLKKL